MKDVAGAKPTVRDDLAKDWLFASCGTLDQATVYRRKIANGTSWEPVLSEPGMGRTTLAIAPSRQNTIYALSASNVPGPDGHIAAEGNRRHRQRQRQ